MGGKRFYIPFHPKHAQELGSNNTELYYEYLKFCQGEDDGVTKSVTQIQTELNLKRSTQDRARRILCERGWLLCESFNGERIKYKVKK